MIVYARAGRRPGAQRLDDVDDRRPGREHHRGASGGDHGGSRGHARRGLHPHLPGRGVPARHAAVPARVPGREHLPRHADRHPPGRRAHGGRQPAARRCWGSRPTRMRRGSSRRSPTRPESSSRPTPRPSWSPWSSLAVLLALRRWFPAVPGPLVVVAGGILLVALTDVEQHGLELIDHVPTGLPVPQLPSPATSSRSSPARSPSPSCRSSRRSWSPGRTAAVRSRRRHRPGAARRRRRLAGGRAHPDPAAGGRLLPVRGQPALGSPHPGRRSRHGRARDPGGALPGTAARRPAPRRPGRDGDGRHLGLLDPRDLRTYERIDRAELWVALIVAFLGLTGGMLLGVAVGVALTLVLVLRQVGQPRVRPVYPRVRRRVDPRRAVPDETGTEDVRSPADVRRRPAPAPGRQPLHGQRPGHA